MSKRGIIVPTHFGETSMQLFRNLVITTLGAADVLFLIVEGKRATNFVMIFDPAPIDILNAREPQMRGRPRSPS